MRDLDVNALAGVVGLAIKTAMGPVLERLAATEQANKELQARLADITGLRDRLVAVETKAALPQAVPVPVDLAPVLERAAATDARVARLAGLELTISELHDKVVAMEAKASQVPPVAAEPHSGPSAAEAELALRDRLEPLTKELAMLHERIALAEARQPIPGPPGKDGQNGADGKDGADGLGFDDLSVDFDGDRTILLKFERGSLKKSWPIQLPFLKYEGSYQANRTYVRGDVVTYQGHMWYCHEADTTKLPGESKAWQQCVQRGREGKAGRDGTDIRPTPVIQLGSPQ